MKVVVDTTSGLPASTTVGWPEGAVRESRDWVNPAIGNPGHKFPTDHITVDLAPVTIKN